jgi:inorganic triphosphatase YgiF
VNIEREIKLRLTREAEQALARLAPATRSVKSVYYDTPRQDLRRAGVALRLRRDGGRWLQTLKAEGAQHAGLAERSEWELPLRARALQPEAFPLGEIRRSTGIDLARLAPRLRPVFETRFTRRSGVVQLGDTGKAELAIDRGAITAGPVREPIREVELELISGDPAVLLRYGEALGLPLAYESKAERGYRLSCGEKRGPRKWRMPQLDPFRPADVAFAALFCAALAQIGTNAAAMASSADPEYLHQLRVGMRRLRALLRAFAPLIRGDKPLRKALRKLAPPLGEARDRDVLVDTLQAARADEPLLRRARLEREPARAAAIAVVESAGFRRFLFSALCWLERREHANGDATLSQLAPQRLERLHRKVLAQSDATTAKRRHALRIRVKRLRYACEFFAPCFAAPAVNPYLRRLARLQDLLGELNDIAVARKLLAEANAVPPSRLDVRERRLVKTLSPALALFTSEPPYWRRAA